MKASLTSELETLLGVEVAMLKTWIGSQERNVESLANDRKIRELVATLLLPSNVSDNSSDPSDVLGSDSPADLLAEALAPAMASFGYDGFFVLDKQKSVLAGYDSQAVGRNNFEDLPGFNDFFSRTLDGKPSVSRPLPSFLPLRDSVGRVRTETPVMFAAAPVRDENFQVVALLAMRMRPEQEFTRILQLGRLGESGETYAFDSDGLMLSQSRFDDDLILLGLLPDEEGSQSILRLLVHDPGGDITQGFRPDRRRRDMPPTQMVASAIEGLPGTNVKGYNDYRGVKVVGAWNWLSEYGFGVATEIDAAEAYRPLTILQRTFWGLFALLGLSSLAIFLFTLQVARLQREAQKAAIEAQQLGQYRLEGKLGAGAMGVVYKAQHAMLRRPTAVKMLEPSKIDEAAINAFEREVQITSQLCHPNTVAIFDYGHTPEGLFYYAMEYLDGISLQDLVERYGPQPIDRVIDILKQTCGSLYEAHTMGLVHRDIKPANIMLNRRAADPDVIKVLDFGLVKVTDEASDTKGIAGTPLYLSPEAIQLPDSVDARSDIYAVGAVGYFLLTGQPVFDADSLIDLCQKHISEAPTPPSQVLGKSVPDELEDAILACLDKSLAKRPQTARDLAMRLEGVSVGDWNVEKADLWWNQHERGTAPMLKSPTTANKSTTATKTVPRDHEATIAHE